MTALALGRPRRRWRFDLNQHRGLIMGVVVFCIVFGGLNLVLAKPFRYFDLASLTNNTAALAIASTGRLWRCCLAASTCPRVR